jgi:hypothetical protein
MPVAVCACVCVCVCVCVRVCGAIDMFKAQTLLFATFHRGLGMLELSNSAATFLVTLKPPLSPCLAVLHTPSTARGQEPH